jgi:ABC-2 type transport system permease protein
MSMILTDIIYNLKMFFRNKMVMFWIFAFPVILFLLFGYLLGGQQGTMTVYYVDHDGSATSKAFLDALNATGAISLVDGSNMDLPQLLKDGKIADYVEIPAGFGNGTASMVSASTDSNTSIQVFYDKSQATSAAVISIVQQVVDGFNLQMSGAQDRISMNSHDVATTYMNYLDFLLPGMIGMIIISVALSSTVHTSAYNRANGIFRKLASTPISPMKWNIAKIGYETVVLLMSVILIMAIGLLVFGIRPNINLMMVLLILAGAIAFSGLGLIMASLVKDGQAATGAANAVSLPLMFLSGSLFPVDQLPWFLKVIADISPLTYLNDGLRAAMVSGDTGAAMNDLLIVGALAIAFFVIGTLTLKWTED